VKDFRELKVWQKGHELTLATYKLTSGFPKHELFGLTSQIRRCSSSIPANIAEGCGRLGNAELHRFLQMACGSVNELEYHFLLAKDLGYISQPDYDSAQKELLDLKRMLVALTRKVGSERGKDNWQVAISNQPGSGK
jgi:four helix bundle protein